MRRTSIGSRPAPPRRGKALRSWVVADLPLRCVDSVDSWQMRGGRARKVAPLHGRARRLWLTRMDSARSSTGGAPGGLRVSPVVHTSVALSPPISWGDASTAWRLTMSPPTAPSLRAASVARKWVMSPGTASGRASHVRPYVVGVIRFAAPVRPRTLWLRPTSVAWVVLRLPRRRPLLAQLPRVGHTPDHLRSVRLLRRPVVHRRRALMSRRKVVVALQLLGQNCRGGILLVAPLLWFTPFPVRQSYSRRRMDWSLMR